MIPRSLSLALKSAVVLFPLLAGGFLTFLGGERLYEANTAQVEKWTTPYGLLAFSSTPLDVIAEKKQIKIQIKADMGTWGADVQQGIAHCTVFGDFQLPSYVGSETDVCVGVQFPFTVVNLRNVSLNWDDASSGQLVEIPVKRANVTVIEEDGLANSLFYVEFSRPQTTEPQHIGLVLDFEWKDVIHREGFSTFTFSLPVALGAGPEIVQPYSQNPNASHVYHAETLGLTVETAFPLDYDVKQAYPEIESMRTEKGSDAHSLFWEINAEAGYGKAIQLVSVNFEDKRLTETRSRLLFDSGLYMGLGVALIFSGIHEAVRTAAEHREKSKPN